MPKFMVVSGAYDFLAHFECHRTLLVKRKSNTLTASAEMLLKILQLGILERYTRNPPALSLM